MPARSGPPHHPHPPTPPLRVCAATSKRFCLTSPPCIRLCGRYVQEARTAALPPWLASTIHPFFASMLHLDTDARVVLATQEYAHVKDQLLGGSGGREEAAGGNRMPVTPLELEEQAQSLAEEGGGGDRPSLEQAVGGLMSEAQTSLKRLEGRRSGTRGGTPRMAPRSTSGSCQSELQQPAEQQQPLRGLAVGRQQASSDGTGGSSPERSQQQAQEQQEEAEQARPVQHEGMVLVAVLLCTLLRGCRLQEYKARVLRLLRDAAAHCDDETRLQRVLPYLVAATAEPLAAVKVVALRAVVRVLAQVWRLCWLGCQTRIAHTAAAASNPATLHPALFSHAHLCAFFAATHAAGAWRAP